MGLNLSKANGLELVGRSTLLQLLASVNPEIAIQASAWAPLDSQLASARGVTFTPVSVEPIPAANMYLGHIPTLIDAPLAKYPNLSVMAYGVGEVPGGGWDQEGHLHRVELYIEVMCKSETDEETVNRRIQRTTDAVNQVVLNDPTLGGLVSSIEFGRADVSDVFERREEKARGPVWFWQGSRLEYTIDKPAAYS